MTDNKDYSKLTLEELLLEEKKMKQNEKLSAAIVGFSIGVMVYGVVKNGFGFLYIFIPLALIVGIHRNSKNVKQQLAQIQAEINNKSTK
jgi:uncharacterized ion transporter superfamily protein YfcC